MVRARSLGSVAAHGTVSRYNAGCRCPACADANTRASRAKRDRARARRLGLPPPASVLDPQPRRAGILPAARPARVAAIRTAPGAPPRPSPPARVTPRPAPATRQQAAQPRASGAAAPGPAGGAPAVSAAAAPVRWCGAEGCGQPAVHEMQVIGWPRPGQLDNGDPAWRCERHRAELEARWPGGWHVTGSQPAWRQQQHSPGGPPPSV
jgi:hypothetical protein